MSLKPALAQWEYKVLVLTASGSTKDHRAELNDAGAEGWDLVSVAPCGAGFLAYLKRRLDA